MMGYYFAVRFILWWWQRGIKSTYVNTDVFFVLDCAVFDDGQASAALSRRRFSYQGLRAVRNHDILPIFSLSDTLHLLMNSASISAVWRIIVLGTL